MKTLIEKRWLEIQMYNYLLKVYHKNNDIQDIIYVIELLSFLFKMPSEAIKNLATRMIHNIRIKPSKKEYAIIALHFKVPVTKIALHTGYTLQYLYNKIKTWDINDLQFYNTEYTDAEYALMELFINKTHELKEWLI